MAYTVEAEAIFATSSHISVWIKGVVADEDTDQEMYIDFVRSTHVCKVC